MVILQRLQIKHDFCLRIYGCAVVKNWLSLCVDRTSCTRDPKEFVYTGLLWHGDVQGLALRNQKCCWVNSPEYRQERMNIKSVNLPNKPYTQDFPLVLFLNHPPFWKFQEGQQITTPQLSEGCITLSTAGINHYPVNKWNKTNHVIRWIALSIFRTTRVTSVSRQLTFKSF